MADRNATEYFIVMYILAIYTMRVLLLLCTYVSTCYVCFMLNIIYFYMYNVINILCKLYACYYMFINICLLIRILLCILQCILIGVLLCILFSLQCFILALRPRRTYY